MSKTPLSVVVHGGNMGLRSALAKHLCRSLERDPLIIGTPDKPPNLPLITFFSLSGNPPDAALAEIATAYDMARHGPRIEVITEATTSPEKAARTCKDALDAQEKRFPIGSVVRLTSGGDGMTVSDNYLGYVGVIFMDNARILQREEFFPEMLVPRLDPMIDDEIPF